MSVYSKTGLYKPRKSAFNLSYDVKMTGDLGKLYPCTLIDCVPGDTMKVANEVVIRMQPMVAPAMVDINAYVHYFFVPYRLLTDRQDLWTDFISGGASGDVSIQLPRWFEHGAPSGQNVKGTLYDYFGFPLNVDPMIPPLAFPKRAVNLIWNEYYRDENLQEARNKDDNTIPFRAWHKDYFTSALPWQQKGTAPALPISGILPLGIYSKVEDVDNWNDAFNNMNDEHSYWASGSYPNWYDRDIIESGSYGIGAVNLANAATFDVSDLRLAFQIQKWMERNARAGSNRYTEFLKAHFGTAPRDEVLQRPVYLGGSKSPVMVSEVLQTSQTTEGEQGSPQGNLAGHGLSANRSYCFSYKVKEYGCIVGLLSVMPKASYMQGVPKQWMRETKYDFYFPEFANLSESAIFGQELYADGTSGDTSIFGYQGRYNEMRSAQSIVCGDMRDTLDYWHLGRKFANRPELNGDFIKCDPSKRIFAVDDEPSMIINFGNIIRAYRPMPAMATPGLIDHN